MFDDEAGIDADRHPEAQWENHLAGVLKQIIRRQGVTYEWLAMQLAERTGGPVSARWLKGELAHGRMSSGLLLQILDCLGIDRLQLADFYRVDWAAREGEK